MNISINLRKPIIKVTEQNTVILSLVLFCSIVILRDITHINVSKLVILFLFMLTFIFVGPNNIVLIICFITPFFNGIPGNLLLLLAITFLAYKVRFQIPINAVVIPLVIITSELLQTVFSQGNFRNMDNLLIYSVYLIYICFVIEKELDIDIRKCLQFFAIGVTIMCVILFFITLNYYPIETIINGTFRYGYIGLEISQQKILLNNNVNNIGYYCIISISVLLTLISRTTKNRIINVLLLLVCVFFGLLTLSRAFILALVLVIVFYVLLNLRMKLKNIAMTILFIAIFSCFLYLVNLLLPDILQGIFQRFREYDITNGRIYLFNFYNDFLMKNPIHFLFGTGLLNMKEVTGMYYAPHNGFQQVYVSYGVIGFIVFLYILNKLVIVNRNGESVKIKTLLVFMSMVIYIQSIQLLNPFELMLPLIISSYSTRLYNLGQSYE